MAVPHPPQMLALEDNGFASGSEFGYAFGDSLAPSGAATPRYGETPRPTLTGFDLRQQQPHPSPGSVALHAAYWCKVRLRLHS